MNKLIIGIIGGVIIIGGGVYFVTKGGDDKTSGNQSQVSTDSKSSFVAVAACDVLTQSVATQVLGAGATKSDTSAGDVSTSETSVSNCSYTVKGTTGSALEQVQNGSAASILVRAAKSQSAADTNKAQFTSAKPAGVQDVSGYGDAAYWNPQFGQLNILKGGNWYILTHYTGTSPLKGTLDQSKQLADAIKNNLK